MIRPAHAPARPVLIAAVTLASAASAAAAAAATTALWTRLFDALSVFEVVARAVSPL